MKSLIFWKNFHHHSDGDFVALRPFRFAGNEYEPGDTFDKSEATRLQTKNLFIARKIVPAGQAETVITASKKVAPVSDGERTATIEEVGAGWLNVLNGDGKKVGKSTRDHAEAESIRDAYLAGEIDAE